MDRRQVVIGGVSLASSLAAGLTAGLVNAQSKAQPGADAATGPLLKRRIPRTGEELPVIGIGTSGPFEVGPAEPDRAPIREVLEAFFAAGATLIDTSPMYSTAEFVLGELMTPEMQKQAFVATKVWTRGAAEGAGQMSRSMKLMKRERIDLMQVHNLLDLATHWKTMRDLQQKGSVRYLGITHYTVASHAELENVIKRDKPDFVQFNYSVSTRDAEKRLLPLCADLGVATLINRAFDDGKLFDRVRERPLPPWAAEIDCTSWAQLLLKYVISNPAVTCVIPATGKRRNLIDNLAAARGRMPDEKQRAAIVEAVMSDAPPAAAATRP